jgi:Zn-dependent oligopeptidase
MVFPSTVKECRELSMNTAKTFQHTVAEVLQEERSLDTVKKLDNAYYQLAKVTNIFDVLTLTNTDKNVREESVTLKTQLNTLVRTHISCNKEVYLLLKAVQTTAADELSENLQYYIDNEVRGMEVDGINQSDEVLAKIHILRGELEVLGGRFEKNIQALCKRQTFTVSKKALLKSGLSKSFVNKFCKKGDMCELPVDLPIYTLVMENCNNSEIRMLMFKHSNRIAYPENNDVLSQLITKRTELAAILGYNNFSDYQLVTQMVGSGAKLDQFYNTIVPTVRAKSEKEITMLKQHFNLTSMEFWDLPYYINKYKKTLGLNEKKLKQHFPVQETVEKLMYVYSSFFGLRFSTVKNTEEYKLWHPDVYVVEVSSTDDNKIYGHIICDTKPRKDKNTHMCCCRVSANNGLNDDKALAVVIANLPEDFFTTAALETYFHEFGHAIHQMLGNAEMASVSGNSTVTDFVECPSIMLENWMWNADILQKIAHTPIPNNLLQAKIDSRTLFQGTQLMRQCMLGQASLQYHRHNMNTYEARQQYWEHIVREYQPGLEYTEFTDLTTRFLHLSPYGSKYYSYMWCLMCSIELFSCIEKDNGLMEPIVGEIYADNVLAPGGGRDPKACLEDFLGGELCFRGLAEYLKVSPSDLRQPIITMVEKEQ